MSDPVRMCIHCRGRFMQAQLIRLQCQNNQIQPFQGYGRSFYLCHSCIDDRKLAKRLAKQCGNRAYLTIDLGEYIRGLLPDGGGTEFKEMIANG